MKKQHILGAVLALVAMLFIAPTKASAATAAWSTSASWGEGSSQGVVQAPANNAVKVRWGMVKGTCDIDYGDVNGGSSELQHKTSFGCDEAEGVVRGLAPKKYAFKVKPEGRGAAPVVVGTATAGVEKTPGLGGENQVKYSKAHKDGQVWHSENWVSTDKINGNGSVHVNFVAHDAPVHIRYTEAGGSAYKFYTVVPGNSGSAHIGSLVEGKSYQFQVGFGDGYNWQKPMRMVAR